MSITTGHLPSWKIVVKGLIMLACHSLALGQTEPATNPEPASDDPPALKEYMGRTIAQTMHWTGASWLIRHIREKEEAGTLMREKLDLKPGLMVCDLGCGNGYHTFPMAQAVAPSGKVYGVEVQEPYLKILNDNAQRQGITNFVPVLGKYHDPNLPDNTFDLILLVDVYHEFSHPEHMLKAMKKALKLGGNIVLVEFRAEDNDVPIKAEHKMTKEQILKEMGANGLMLVKEFDGLPWQHMMWFGMPVPDGPVKQKAMPAPDVPLEEKAVPMPKLELKPDN